jgi:hypothetical protein
METSKLVLLLLPIVIIQLTLMIVALVDLVKREKVTGGNKLIWGIIIVLFNIIGPIIYFIIGRKEA